MTTHAGSFGLLAAAAVITIAAAACGGFADRIVGPAPELEFEQWEVDPIPPGEPAPSIEVTGGNAQIRVTAYADGACYSRFRADVGQPVPPELILTVEVPLPQDQAAYCVGQDRPLRYEATILKLQAGEYELEVRHFGDTRRPDGTVLDTLVTVQ